MRGNPSRIHIAWVLMILTATIVYCSYRIFFGGLVSKIIKNQSLNAEDEIDAAIISFGFRDQFHAFTRKQLFCLIGGGATAVSVLALIIIAKTLSLPNIQAVSMAMSMGPGLAAGFSILGSDAIRMSLPKKESAEKIEMLTAYFMRQNGNTEAHIKETVWNASKDDFLITENNRIRSLMYPGSKLKKNRTIGTLICMLPFFIGIIPLVYFFMDYVFGGKRESLYLAGTSFVAMFILTGITVFVSFILAQRKQRDFLNTDQETYKYHLELLNEKTKHFKRLFLIIFAAFSAATAIGCGVFLLAHTLLLEALTYGLLIGFAAAYIALMRTSMTLTRKYNQKIRAVTDKMGHHTANNAASCARHCEKQSDEAIQSDER
ncbi:MAG: hypothetical protein FWE62_02070 [Firmicutes bacterium]|nr:hypothetical protein [Bacillota bacterium]